MVKLSVKTLGQRRPTCYARPQLYAAHASLDRGDTIAGGVQLLEAMRRYVAAMCVAHCVKPARSLRRVIKQLLAAKGIDDSIAEWLNEIVDMGQKCQQCQSVKPKVVEAGVCFMHVILDHSTELELPTRGGVV